MEKYILELIEDNNRVIIPNFGAFIITKEDGISILFNNFLSFNDGLLVNYIAEKEDLDTITATDKVFDYVDNLKKELDENGEFVIENLGVFNKDKNGILRFQQADLGTQASSTLDTKERPEVTSEKEIIILDTDKAPNEIAPSLGTQEIEKKIEEDIKKEEAIQEPVLTIDKEDVPKVEEKKDNIKKPAVTSTPPKKENKKPEASKNMSSATIKNNKTTVTNHSKTDEAIKKRKKKDIVTFVIIASVILLGLAIYLLFFSKPKAPKPQPKVPANVVVVDSVEIKRQDSLRIAQQIEAARLDSIRRVEEERMAISGKFHLIVGSFKLEKNADNLAIELQDKGYTNAQYFKNNSMYFVSIDNNKKYGPIEVLQQDVLSKERLSSWIFKMK